uniref:Uncharacterized protein n=1 Tax=Anguilla anguilla TaxID=7936 RepID=A0A0E9RDC1_ANGAN
MLLSLNIFFVVVVDHL